MRGYRQDPVDIESDSDDDEIQIKQYLNPGIKNGQIQPKAFQESLQSAKALQNLHTGVKRQPGHYMLRDCKHAVFESKYHSYEGKHWDVSTRSDLQRSTKRLTMLAIKKAVEMEQQQRSKQEKKERKRAVSLFGIVNEQFQSQVDASQRRTCAEEHAFRNKLELVKDDLQVELVRGHNMRLVDEEREAERKYQMRLLRAMADDTMKTASIENLVEGMTDTNAKRSIINTDLEEANMRLQEDEEEEDEEEVNHEYQSAMGEMLDESLIKVSFMLDRDKLAQQAEHARVEKMKDLKSTPDKDRKKTIHDFRNVMKTLMQVYKKVQKREEEEEEACRQKVLNLKMEVQEELVRNMAKKWVNKVFSEEKARRIQESEEEMNKPNPARDAMMRVMNRVQRQLLLQKFKGKWVNLVRKPKAEIEAHECELSEHDRKLKQLRTRSRKESCVVRGAEE